MSYNINCLNCSNFRFAEESNSDMGVCHLTPPTTDGLPTVNINNRCASWHKHLNREDDLKPGTYANVTTDCLDGDGLLIFPADDSRIVRILGIPQKGFCEIVTTNMCGSTTSGARIYEHESMFKYHAVVSQESLTPIPNRFEVGNHAELSRSIIETDDFGTNYPILIGTPVKITGIPRVGFYTVNVGRDRGNENYTFYPPKLHRREIPDSILKPTTKKL